MDFMTMYVACVTPKPSGFGEYQVGVATVYPGDFMVSDDDAKWESFEDAFEQFLEDSSENISPVEVIESDTIPIDDVPVGVSNFTLVRTTNLEEPLYYVVWTMPAPNE